MTSRDPAPTTLETDRLCLRQPCATDAEVVFERYASDPEVTRYLSWPTHRSIDETRTFLAASDAEWERWPAGPFLICSRTGGEILGGTGLGFETAERASTGYVLARNAWGHGFATEALEAMVALAGRVGIRRLYALCHPDHQASRRVLEKCAFQLEGTLARFAEFPNLEPEVAADVVSYAQSPDATGRERPLG